MDKDCESGHFLLRYEGRTLSFPSFIFLRCHLIHHLHLPSPLCFPGIPFAIQFSNHFSFCLLIFSHDERLSPKVITHPSMTFQHVPQLGLCSDCNHINTVSSCITSLKLDLHCVALQSRLFIFHLSCPSSIRADLVSTTLHL